MSELEVQPPGAGSQPLWHLIVIGAGLSGLSLATELLRLRSSSVRLSLIESRPRLGGRLLSLPGNLELGASWYWPHHDSVRRMLADLHVNSFPDYEMDGSRVQGGAQQLALRLWERLSAHPNISVRLSTSAAAIQRRADDELQVTLADGELLSAQAVAVCVPPRLAVSSLRFDPPLPPSYRRGLSGVSTWMGSITKATASSSTPFWQRMGLPYVRHRDDGIVEWHDASSDIGPGPAVHALMGFGGPGVSKEKVEAQLRRFYGSDCPAHLSVNAMDWSRERWTSSGAEDGSGGHPVASEELRHPLWDGRLVFASTEMAEREAGYMEGAIIRGRQVAALLSQASTTRTGKSESELL